MNTDQPSLETFSLSEGGPFDRALTKLHLHDKQGKIALAALCITWLPLVIITGMEGTLYSGPKTAFLNDIAMQARLLIAMPMLVLIKLAIDSKVIVVTRYLSEAMMNAEEREHILNTALKRVKTWTNSTLTEVILLLIVITTTVSFVEGGVYTGLNTGTESWMATSKEGIQKLTLAGYWAVTISIPFFQFLLFRWLWRYFVWVLLLFRLSKAKLNLLPTHADRAGGLGIILLAQRSFNLLFVTGSVLISGGLITRLIQNPDSFNTIRSEMIGYVVMCLGLLILPLFFFTAKLVKVKNEGLLQTSRLAVTLSSQFEKEWVNELPDEKVIAEKKPDPSMIYDYSGIYDSLQLLRIVPVTPRDSITMALTLFVPFIPIFFIHYSVAELLQRVLKLLV
jgi:hypothetical protein